MNKIKRISSKEAHGIIDRYNDSCMLELDYGLFICKENNKYIGIDNLYGHCWVEEFDSFFECKVWLLGEEAYEN